MSNTICVYRRIIFGGNMGLTPRDLDRLAGVHPDLVRVVRRAREEAEFIVTEGVRSEARQRQLMIAGATRTMNSRHITGHAVDVAALVDGEVRWDWPLYTRLSTAFKRAAMMEQVPLVWGGDWPTFRDGPHYELPRANYP
jgi:peptidoglycan L-alanyl-D-glutamate endopeptidase CwlK